MTRDFVRNMFVVKLFLDALSYLTSSLSINNEWSIRRNIKICLLNCIVIILHCRYYNMTGYHISYLASSSKIICTYCITANAFQFLRFQNYFIGQGPSLLRKEKRGNEERYHQSYQINCVSSSDVMQRFQWKTSRFAGSVHPVQYAIWYVLFIFHRASD